LNCVQAFLLCHKPLGESLCNNAGLDQQVIHVREYDLIWFDTTSISAEPPIPLSNATVHGTTARGVPGASAGELQSPGSGPFFGENG
jgi:hypothetical protein